MERRFRQITVSTSLVEVILKGFNGHITSDAPTDIQIVSIDGSEIQELGRFKMTVFSKSFEIVPPGEQCPILDITFTRHYPDPAVLEVNNNVETNQGSGPDR